MEGDPEVGPGASAELGDLPSSALILHILHVCSWKRHTRLDGGVSMCRLCLRMGLQDLPRDKISVIG